MSPGAGGPAAAFATVSLAIAGFCAILGPQSMRGDLRGDLPHLEQLKTWPVRAAAVIRGEMLWPATALTLCAWLALVCGTIFSTAAFPELPLVSRLSLFVAAILVAPALIAAQLTVHNAAAVLFPAWVTTGRQRPRGLEAMGQRLILFGGVMLSLVLLVGPGAIAGGIVIFALQRLIGAVSIIPAAVVCVAIVAIEILLVTEMLGGAYDRIDLSQVERSE
jgi:ABC-2 type transport system permease protein